MTIAPAIVGSRVGGAVRGSVQEFGISSDVAVANHGDGDADGDADDRTEGEPETEVPHRPADQRARNDTCCGEAYEHTAGPGEGERRSRGLHRPGAYQGL